MKQFNAAVIFLLLALLGFPAGAAASQAPTSTQQLAPTDDKSQAYYHFTLGHLYEEMAGMLRRSDYLLRAIEEYQQALRYDSNSPELILQLAGVYRSAGRIREAVTETQEILRENPDDLSAHRLLGQIYLQTLGGLGRESSGRATVGLAIEQYEHIVRLAPDDTGALLDLARLYRFNNQTEQAEAMLKKLLELDPQSEKALIQLAQLYTGRGDARSAIERLEQVTEGTSSAQLLLSLAAAYQQVGDNDSAIEVYRRALEAQGSGRQVRRRLAEALLRAERTDEALVEFEALVTEDPNDTEALLQQAQIYRTQKRYDEARQALARARESASARPDLELEAIFNQALLHEVQGDFRSAMSVLRDLLERMTNPSGRYSAQAARSRAAVAERLGVVQRQNQDYQDAVKTFRLMEELGDSYAQRAAAQIIESLRQQRNLDAAVAAGETALERFPDDVDLKLQLAGVLGERGDVERAAALSRAQLDNGADPKQVQLTLAQIYERNRRFDEALAALDRARDLSPAPRDRELVHFLRGAVYERSKQYDKAEAEFRRVLEINPGSSLALNYLGYMLADRNVQLEEALALIQKAVDQDPYNGSYLDSLGWAYFRLQKMDLAEKYLLQAVERDSHDPTILDHLGDVYYHTGRLHLAGQAWERALAEWKQLPATDQDREQQATVEDKLHRVKVRLAQQRTHKPAPPLP